MKKYPPWLIPAVPGLAVVPLALVLVSCVPVPYGADYYETAPIYGGSGSGWRGERWEREEAHRREMVRRQEAYRRRHAARDREGWRWDEDRRDGGYDAEPSRRDDAGAAPWEAGPPELRPDRRLESSDPAPPESRERDQGDYPAGIPVIGKEGMAYNPAGNPDQMIDVRGIPSGTLVKDPYTDTLFRVP